jgi:hypothetical protein
MSYVSNKLKMSKSELAAAIWSVMLPLRKFALKWPEVRVSRQNNKQNIAKGSDYREAWLTSDRYKSLIEQNASYLCSLLFNIIVFVECPSCPNWK